jgi:hypothetical protein
MASSVPIFTKLISVEYIFVDISCSEIYPNLTKNEEDTSPNSFTPLSLVSIHPILKKLTNG